jgi:Tol biopolymer transport system component
MLGTKATTWADIGDVGALGPRPYEAVGLSPDGTRAALQVSGGVYGYLAVHDFRTGATRRLTVQENNSHPVWSPDGLASVYPSMQPPEPQGYPSMQPPEPQG